MLPTAFAALLVDRTRPAFQGTRRSVSTIPRARRCRDPGPRLVWTIARLRRSRASRALFAGVRERGLRLARNKRFNFVSIEPDEMAALADIDVDFPLVG